MLFADVAIEDAIPHLEELRGSIENYRMSSRTDQRRQESRNAQDRRVAVGKQKRNAKSASIEPAQTLSVTVSIGVAQNGQRLGSPPAVIKAADQALYRAKEGGRNRVSR